MPTSDGLTYTFSLRGGLTFHDGAPLDARAVVWNFQRWMDPDHPAHVDGFVAWQALFGGGADPDPEAKLPTGLVKRVVAIDATTVRITLNAPFAPFVHALAGVPFGLASPRAVQDQGEDYGSDADHLPVGSGPFRCVAWSEDGAVRLMPFTDYRAGPPAAPGLRFVALEDAAARLRAVAAGEADGADLPPRTDTAEAKGSRIRLVPRPARSTVWLVLNHSRPPLDDMRVRKAISLAIDRKALARDHFGPYTVPAGQLLPPLFPGRAEGIEAPPRSLAMSKALMRESGAQSFKLNIWVATTPRPYLPDPAGTAEAVADMLADIGIDAKVKSEGLREFLSDRDRGRFSAWILGWQAQSADPDNFWFWHFGAGRLAAEGQYDRPDLAALLLDAQRSLSPEARAAAYSQAAAMVDNDAARVFLAYPRPIVALGNQLQDFDPSPMAFDSFLAAHVSPRTEAPRIPPTTGTARVTATTTATTTATVTATVTITAGATTAAPPSSSPDGP